MCRLLFAHKNFDLLLARVTKYLFKIKFFCTAKCPKLSLEFCNISITDYFVAVVLFSHIFIIGQHCNNNVPIFRSSSLVF